MGNFNKTKKLIRRYEQELNSPGPLSDSIKGIFGKKIDGYTTRQRLQKSINTKRKKLRNMLMTKQAQTALQSMVEKVASPSKFKDMSSLPAKLDHLITAQKGRSKTLKGIGGNIGRYPNFHIAEGLNKNVRGAAKSVADELPKN